MSQPVWKLLKNLGDVSPVDYGGYFVFVDETGVYPPEGELLEAPDDNDDPIGWTIYRFILDRCTLIDGILSDNAYHPEISAWFADSIGAIARCNGQSELELMADLCSENPIDRAMAYRSIGHYHGFENLDPYPLRFHDRANVETRYEGTR